MKNKSIFITIVSLSVFFIFTVSSAAFTLQGDKLLYTWDSGSTNLKLYATDYSDVAHSDFWNVYVPSGSSGTNVNYHGYEFDSQFSLFKGTSSTTLNRYANGWFNFSVNITIRNSNNGICYMLDNPFSIVDCADGVQAYIESCVVADEFTGSTSSQGYIVYKIQIFVFIENYNFERGAPLFHLKHYQTTRLTVNLDYIYGNFVMNTDHLTYSTNPANEGLVEQISYALNNCTDINTIITILTQIKDGQLFNSVINKLQGIQDVLNLVYQNTSSLYLKILDIEADTTDISSQLSQLQSQYQTELARYDALIKSLSGVDYNNPNIDSITFNRWVDIIRAAIAPLQNLFDVNTDFTDDSIDNLKNELVDSKSGEEYFWNLVNIKDESIELPSLLHSQLARGVNYCSGLLTTLYDGLPLVVTMMITALLVVVVLRSFLGSH